MSSNSTGEAWWPRELSDTIRALPAAASASWSPTARAKWPRWLEANWSSQPSGVRSSAGSAITPALLTRMCRGPVQALAKAVIDALSARSRRPTRTLSFPVALRISVAVRSPASVLRTARVTEAPALTRARAVSAPRPEPAPVTTACLPLRSMPSMTSVAVDSSPKGSGCAGWLS